MTEHWILTISMLALIFIIIFMSLDPYTKKKFKGVLTTGVISFLVLGLMWILFAIFGPEIKNWSLAHIIMPFFFFILITTYLYIEGLKNKSPQFLAKNFHGSYSATTYPIEKNGFLIYGIGSFQAGGLHWDYAKEVVVVRKETAELFDKGSVSIADLSSVNLYRFTSPVVNEIKGNKFLKDATKFHYGWFDNISQVDYTAKQLRDLRKEKNSNTTFNMLKSQLKVSNPRVQTLLDFFMNQSEAYNKLREYFNSTIDVVETGVEHGRSVRDAYDVREQPTQQIKSGSEEKY